jgi:hypothetical protein
LELGLPQVPGQSSGAQCARAATWYRHASQNGMGIRTTRGVVVAV